MGSAARNSCLALDRLCIHSIPVKRISAPRLSRDSAPLRDHDRQSLPRTSLGSQSRIIAVWPSSYTARASGMADDRRDRANLVEALSTSRFVGMGDRRGFGLRSRTRTCWLLSPNGRRSRVSVMRGHRRCLLGIQLLVDRGSFGRSLDAVTSHRMVGEPGATLRPKLVVGRGRGKLTAHGAAHLALF